MNRKALRNAIRYELSLLLGLKYSEEEPRDYHGRWTSAGFSTIADAKKLPDHIAALKIPPGWKDVFFNPDPKGNLRVDV